MSTAITGNLRKALVNNAYLYDKIIWGLRNRFPTFRAMTGHNEPGSMDAITKWLKFPSVQHESGYQFAMQFNMNVPVMNTLPSGTPELEFITGEFIDDVEEYSWDLRRQTYPYFVSSRLNKQVAGKELKTEDMMDQALKNLAMGFCKGMNADLFASTDQSETSVLSLDYAISTSNVYGFDRSLARYADLRSNVTATVGALSWDDVALIRNLNFIRWGGHTEVGIGDATTYTWIERLAREQDLIEIGLGDDWAGFGGQMFRYGTTVFHGDTDCPAGTIFLPSIKSEEMDHWKMVMNDAKPMVPGAFREDITREGFPLMLPFDCTHGWFCATPGAQGKLTGVTAPTGFSS